MRNIHPLLVLSFLLAGSVSAAEENMDLSYGMTYPQGALTPSENPAALALGKGDQLAFFSPLPWQFNSATHQFNDNGSKAQPFIGSFTAKTAPFGIGMMGTSGPNSEVYGALGCGNQLIQFGYGYHVAALTQNAASTLALRIGSIDEHALTIMWGDERKALGIGFVFGWVRLELDATAQTLLSSVSNYQATVGIQNNTIGFNIGRSAHSLPDLPSSRANQHLGASVKILQKVAATLYYGRFSNQFLLGLAATFN